MQISWKNTLRVSIEVCTQDKQPDSVGVMVDDGDGLDQNTQLTNKDAMDTRQTTVLEEHQFININDKQFIWTGSMEPRININANRKT